jgi:hypothetical protein
LALSILDQIKKLDEQKAQLLESAKTEALAKAEAAVKELTELGFSYRLTEGEKETKRKTRSRNTDPNKKYCKICDMKGHDGRAHRNQDDKKKKFTAAELKDLELA